MEQECQYVQNSSGEVVLHPKTGEPLQNCKVTKSDLLMVVEKLEQKWEQSKVTKPALTPATEATASNSTEIQPKKL
jgi:hypothetical protein